MWIQFENFQKYIFFKLNIPVHRLGQNKSSMFRAYFQNGGKKQLFLDQNEWKKYNFGQNLPSKKL